jgi:hypothetical protein
VIRLIVMAILGGRIDDSPRQRITETDPRPVDLYSLGVPRIHTRTFGEQSWLSSQDRAAGRVRLLFPDV